MAYHQQPQYSPNMYPVQQPPLSQQQQQYPTYQHQPQQQQVYSMPHVATSPSSSQPSLPRYTSQASSLGSPLNPAANMANGMRPGSSGSSSSNGAYGASNPSLVNAGPRYGGNGYGYGAGSQGSAHPLSHALYADSPSSSPRQQHPPQSPRMQQQQQQRMQSSDGHDEKSGLASFPPAPSSSSSGSSGPRARAARDRAANAGNSAYRRWSGAYIADSGVDARHTKTERQGWMDGLRFLAAWAVVNATFFAAVIPDANMYSAIQRSSPLYIFRCFGLALSFLLIILGRACTAQLWELSSSTPTKPGAAPTGPTISFPRLTRAMLTRTSRFVFPVLVIAAVIWGLGATNATKDCNAAGMQQPYWNLVRNFAGYMTLVFNSFSAFSYQTQMAQYFAGNLWTNAWFFQASFCVYICHMMLGNLSTARFWIYGILIFFMWTTYQYFALAMIGLILSDLAAHGAFARVKKWPFIRTFGIQIVLIAIACALQFVNVARNGLNNAMAKINVTNHGELQFADLVFATCFMLVFETSSILQVILGNVVMRMLGKLAAGMYLLAPIITYTIVPALAVKLSKSGTAGTSVLAVTWVVCFASCTILAIPFHFLVELPSKLAGEWICEFLEKWGRSPDDMAPGAVKAPQKSAPKKISGPGQKYNLLRYMSIYQSSEPCDSTHSARNLEQSSSRA